MDNILQWQVHFKDILIIILKLIEAKTKAFGILYKWCIHENQHNRR